MAEITGRIIGAYREEGFILDNSGNPVDLVHILNMILNGGADVNANNGLNVNDGFVQLGGPLIDDTTVTNTDKLFKLGKDTGNNVSLLLQDALSKLLSIQQETANDLGYLAISPTGFGINVRDKGTEIASGIEMGNEFIDLTVANLDTGTILSGLSFKEDQLIAFGLRSYANTAAAQADSTLLTGGLYTITTEPTILRIKHA